MSDDVKVVRDWQAKWETTEEKSNVLFAHPYKNELKRILDHYEEMEKVIGQFGCNGMCEKRGYGKIECPNCELARETLRKVRGE